MLTIRKGEKKDLPFILELIKELAKYENAIEQVSITLSELEKDGFGLNQHYHFLVAEKENNIIGMSFYWFRYSTWKGRFLFLEDFIVKKNYRRQGVGTALFNATIKVCQEQNINGMCWQVLDWNQPAIKFYKKYNASISREWLNGKLDKTQLVNFHVDTSS
tara:strand:- start:744 stop:1226 length:483 start_codon:yes stop_codon:yes gene_type:complete